MANYKHYCAACNLRAQCEYTFGKFYADKSSNATGCNNKIRSFDLERVKQCAAAVHPSDVMTANIKTSQNRNGVWHKYTVIHDGWEYSTAARSEAEAINSVRFRLYGRTPAGQCGDFEARVVESGFDKDAPKSKPSKADILERLKNMRVGRNLG